MDYYSPFWGPEAICVVIKPEGALMCRSSTLAVLADSDPFRGLLLTDFRSRGDPNIRGTPGVRLRGPRKNPHIWSILTSFLRYYPLILGPGAIRTFVEPRGPVMGMLSKLVDLVPYSQFSVLLPTNFGSPGDPNVWGTPGSGYGDVVKTRSFGPFQPVF